MLDPFSVEMHARYRHEEGLRHAAHEQLLRDLRRARPRGQRRRLAEWLGTRLVQWGYRLLPLSHPLFQRSYDRQFRAPRPWPFEPLRPTYGAARTLCRPATLRLPRRYSLAGE